MFKVSHCSQLINFIKNSMHICYNKCFLWRDLSSVWMKKPTLLIFLLWNYTQVLKWPVKYYFWWLRYMIVRINNRVQLSIYSTSSLFHKYCVVIMKYRWICKFLILSECPSLSETLSALLELIVYFVLLWVIAILYFHSLSNT